MAESKRKAAHDPNSFLLQIVQPGLSGLMDGSVSTLAAIFATAFATHNSHRQNIVVGEALVFTVGVLIGSS